MENYHFCLHNSYLKTVCPLVYQLQRCFRYPPSRCQHDHLREGEGEDPPLWRHRIELSKTLEGMGGYKIKNAAVTYFLGTTFIFFENYE